MTDNTVDADFSFLRVYNTCTGEDGTSSEKGSSVSLRERDSVTSKGPSSAPSEASLLDHGDTDAAQEGDKADSGQADEEPRATPSPPLSPTTSDISDHLLVNQSQEATWREVTVSGGE